MDGEAGGLVLFLCEDRVVNPPSNSTRSTHMHGRDVYGTAGFLTTMCERLAV